MRRLLISCSWTYPEQLDRFVSLLDRHGYEYDDRTVFPHAPIPVTNRTQLLGALADRISRVSTVVVMATEDAHRKDIVTFEIEEALRQGKRVVAVQPLGTAHGPVPRLIAENADAIVSFRGNQIVDAIDGANIRMINDYPIAEEEAVRDLANWIIRSAAGTVIIGAFTIEHWLPSVNALLADSGIRVVSNGCAPDFSDVLLGAGLGGVLGYAVGSQFRDPRLAATCATVGAAIGAGIVVKRAMELRVVRTDGLLRAEYTSLNMPRLLP